MGAEGYITFPCLLTKISYTIMLVSGVAYLLNELGLIHDLFHESKVLNDCYSHYSNFDDKTIGKLHSVISLF